MATLPGRLSRVAVLRWVECADPSNIAYELRIKERQASYLIAQAKELITEKLCPGLQ
jgi:hypothetical protein